MKLLVASFILLSLAVAAAAQAKPTWTVDAVHQSYDASTDVGKAMSLCAQHRHVAPMMQPKGGYVVQYDDGWDSCNDVHAAWEKSKDATDKAFVSGVASGLKQ